MPTAGSFFSAENKYDSACLSLIVLLMISYWQLFWRTKIWPTVKTQISLLRGKIYFVVARHTRIILTNISRNYITQKIILSYIQYNVWLDNIINLHFLKNWFHFLKMNTQYLARVHNNYIPLTAELEKWLLGTKCLLFSRNTQSN